MRKLRKHGRQNARNFLYDLDLLNQYLALGAELDDHGHFPLVQIGNFVDAAVRAAIYLLADEVSLLQYDAFNLFVARLMQYSNLAIL